MAWMQGCRRQIEGVMPRGPGLSWASGVYLDGCFMARLGGLNGRDMGGWWQGEGGGAN
jgi:hypothetical protein